MIVVDTTVWIDFFNGAGTPEEHHLQKLISEERSIALTDLIFCEILQGIPNDKEYERTRNLLLQYPIFLMDGLPIFEQAAMIYRACRKRGLTIRKTIDCLIASVCIANDLALFQKDSDFDYIAQVTPLKVHHPVPR